MSHGWGHVEPSLSMSPALAANVSSSLVGWASHTSGWLCLSPSPARRPLSSPHHCFFTYGRDIHIFTIRSFWPQLALSKEDKPLSLDVRNSWLQNNFFAACCSGWDCNTWSYIIIKIEIYELDFPALSFAASVSSFLSFNALVQEFSQYSWMSWWYVLFDPYLRAFQMVTDKCYWQGCGKGCIFHITVVYILQACVLFG